MHFIWPNSPFLHTKINPFVAASSLNGAAAAAARFEMENISFVIYFFIFSTAAALFCV